MLLLLVMGAGADGSLISLPAFTRGSVFVPTPAPHLKTAHGTVPLPSALLPPASACASVPVPAPVSVPAPTAGALLRRVGDCGENEDEIMGVLRTMLSSAVDRKTGADAVKLVYSQVADPGAELMALLQQF